jgi:hypothetical protein
MTVAYNNNNYYCDNNNNNNDDNNNNNNKHAYAGQLNSFTHQRALLVLHDCGILACW